MNREETNFLSHALPAPVLGGFRMADYWVWCGSVIKGEDSLYHMFASRWRKTLPFHPGWGMESEIVRATSKTPEGPYEFAEVVLGFRGAQFWDGRSCHNPVILFHNGEYLLFYVGITHPFRDIPIGGELTHHSYQWLSARSNKRIGLATAKKLTGPWRRPEAPLLSTDPNGFDSFLVSNPAPVINPDGSCLLIYKARGYQQAPYKSDETFGQMVLGAAFAKDVNGPYKRLSEKPLFSAEEGELEDPFMYRVSGGYRMLAKDWRGSYTGDVGSLVSADSTDGVNWKVNSGVALSREILWSDGVKRRMGNIDRPFLLFNGEDITHLFFATNNGSEAGFSTLTESFNACLPFK